MNIPVEELLNLTIPDKSLKLQDKIAITIGNQFLLYCYIAYIFYQFSYSTCISFFS